MGTNHYFRKMICTLTVVRYPRWMGWAGVLSMALFRLPVWIHRKNAFRKLMGCGKNGTFDQRPDWRQWAVLEASDFAGLPTPGFLLAWWQFFRCEKWTLVMEPIEGHGTWDGKKVFGELPAKSGYEGRIGILTRATIRISKVTRFWKHVDPVAKRMADADGLVTSLGIGELPWIKQATFSIWESREQMKRFAYQMQEHAEVIRKTRTENWYSEDMFVRFRIISSNGNDTRKAPLPGKP